VMEKINVVIYNLLAFDSTIEL